MRNVHEILRKNILEEPNCIIIHTGTNDLRAEQERVGALMCRAAERVAETFPNAQMIISTLLPPKDFHPATIQRVNAHISRGCALTPNVNLAHHINLTLYNHVHLNKHGVKEFAKTLKATSLEKHTPTHTAGHQRGQSPKLQHTHQETTNTPTPSKNTNPTHLKPAKSTSTCSASTTNQTNTTQTSSPTPPSPANHTAQCHHPNYTATEAPLSLTQTPPAPRSYAEALRGPQHTNQMSESKQLLQYICNRLITKLLK